MDNIVVTSTKLLYAEPS